MSFIRSRRRGDSRQRRHPDRVPVSSRRGARSNRWRSRRQHADTHGSRSGAPLALSLSQRDLLAPCTSGRWEQFARALHAITLLIAHQMVRDLRECVGKVDVFTVPNLCPLDASPYDFSRAGQLIEQASERTAKADKGFTATKIFGLKRVVFASTESARVRSDWMWHVCGMTWPTRKHPVRSRQI